MPKESESQERTIDRVMHEYKHGELKSVRETEGRSAKMRRNLEAEARRRHSPAVRR
jgi:hypothetical protein